jgi:hypothetical protein
MIKALFVCEKQTMITLEPENENPLGVCRRDLAGRTKCHIEQNRFHVLLGNRTAVAQIDVWSTLECFVQLEGSAGC